MPTPQTDYRVRKLSFAQILLASMQLVMCIIVVTFGAMTKVGNNPLDVRSLFSGCVGLFSSLIGVAGGLKEREIITRVYFVLQLWMLSTVTAYLYVTIDEEDTQHSLCSPSRTFSSIDISNDMCSYYLSMYRAKLSFAAIGLFITLLTCMVSMDYEDALDDKHDQIRAERMDAEDEKKAQEFAERALRAGKDSGGAPALSMALQPIAAEEEKVDVAFDNDSRPSTRGGLQSRGGQTDSRVSTANGTRVKSVAPKTEHLPPPPPPPPTPPEHHEHHLEEGGGDASAQPTEQYFREVDGTGPVSTEGVNATPKEDYRPSSSSSQKHTGEGNNGNPPQDNTETDSHPNVFGEDNLREGDEEQPTYQSGLHEQGHTEGSHEGTSEMEVQPHGGHPYDSENNPAQNNSHLQKEGDAGETTEFDTAQGTVEENDNPPPDSDQRIQHGNHDDEFQGEQGVDNVAAGNHSDEAPKDPPSQDYSHETPAAGGTGGTVDDSDETPEEPPQHTTDEQPPLPRDDEGGIAGNDNKDQVGGETNDQAEGKQPEEPIATQDDPPHPLDDEGIQGNDNPDQIGGAYGQEEGKQPEEPSTTHDDPPLPLDDEGGIAGNDAQNAQEGGNGGTWDAMWNEN
eukprot:PhF_6_TR43138/c0_g1_i3/m.66008